MIKLFIVRLTLLGNVALFLWGTIGYSANGDWLWAGGFAIGLVVATLLFLYAAIDEGGTIVLGERR